MNWRLATCAKRQRRDGARPLRWSRRWPIIGDGGTAPHRMLNETISTLAAEADEAEIGTLFAVATTLHTNFYEGGLSHAIIEDSLHQTSRFIDRLEALLPA